MGARARGNFSLQRGSRQRQMTESRKENEGAKTNADTDIEITVSNDSPQSETAENQAGDEPSENRGEDETPEVGEVGLAEALDAAQSEAKASHERLLRATAELENFKKRTAREMADFKKFANERLIQALLPVIDNLEMAIQSASEDEQANGKVVEGVMLTLAELKKVLESFGVAVIEAEGEPFDPKFHQAFVQEENDKLPPNTVLKAFQKGYLLHERLIRPAMVIVSKKSSSSEGAE
jgi:molecular chaperone GrpE